MLIFVWELILRNQIKWLVVSWHLPHGIGKDVRVLVLCTPDKEQEAKDAGAEHVGLDDYIKKIEGGWTDIDVIICMPYRNGESR